MEKKKLSTGGETKLFVKKIIILMTTRYGILLSKSSLPICPWKVSNYLASLICTYSQKLTESS